MYFKAFAEAQPQPEIQLAVTPSDPVLFIASQLVSSGHWNDAPKYIGQRFSKSQINQTLQNLVAMRQRLTDQAANIQHNIQEIDAIRMRVLAPALFIAQS